MTDQQKTVFISYRRSVSWAHSRLIFDHLRAHGYDVFMDVESMHGGLVESIVFNQIAARAHFLIILTTGSVKRCTDKGDLLRREIELAMSLQRNIVPILVDSFSFRKNNKYLVDRLAELQKYSGLPLSHDFFDAAMERLRTQFLERPATGVIQPTPAVEKSVVEQRIEQTASEPPPTREQLTAEQYFERGNARGDSGDLVGAIADYTEAIRLTSQIPEAYFNRGLARRRSGDLVGAIADYTEAIRLNPQFAEAYDNRGATRQWSGDYAGAIVDHTAAIHLNPQLANAHNNRAYASYRNGDLAGAVVDCNEAIRLNAKDANIYDTRAQVYFAQSSYAAALADYMASLKLNPQKQDALAGQVITLHALGRIDEAREAWQHLIDTDARYRDADWVGKELDWAPPLIEEARKLIASLD
jgi:tetratricopeptide (TPR) repeat protein